MPKISVIIPTYNGERYIEQAVDSVLAQTYGDFEIIVVDDGSTDGTAAILRDYGDRITYIYQTNQKLPVARNNGIAASIGDYIAFLDSDDVFMPEKLEQQVQMLDRNPEIGLVASGYEIINENEEVISSSRPWIYCPSITLESIFFGGLAPPSAILIRRSWVEQVRGFDPEFIYTEDMDFWYRLALSGCGMTWSTAVSCKYRVHSENKSNSLEVHFQYFRKAIERAFSDPRMPDSLRARRAELDAQIDLSEAARLLAGGWEDAAGERVRRAVAGDPALLADNGRGLAELVMGFQSDVWGDGRLAAFTINILHDRMPALAHTLATVDAKKRFYTAFSERQAAAVRQSWFDVARREPRWFLNRGGWSILAQSFAGFR